MRLDSPQPARLGAVAFARGEEVFFAPGAFAPETPRGRRLLGHELAHVVQQRGSQPPPTASRAGAPVNRDPALEREASNAARLFAAGGASSPLAGGAGPAQAAGGGVAQLQDAADDLMEVLDDYFGSRDPFSLPGFKSPEEILEGDAPAIEPIQGTGIEVRPAIIGEDGELIPIEESREPEAEEEPDEDLPDIEEGLRSFEEPPPAPLVTTLLFNKGSDRLTPRAAAQLDQFIASARRRFPTGSVAVTVTGYASEEGTETYNRKLSFKRSKTVAAVFQAGFGGSIELFQTSGRGETAEFGPRAENRRVVLVVRSR